MLILILVTGSFSFAAKTEVVFDKGQSPIWGFDFVDDKQILFSERDGKLSLLNLTTKKVTPVQGVPKVWNRGQGGLLDVRLHPKDKSIVYLTFSEPKGKGGTTSVFRGELVGDNLKNGKVIFSSKAVSENTIHFGSRLAFDGKGYLFMTIGDRNERDQVLDLAYHTGKIIRLKEDGSVPSDNPYVGVKGALPEIWAVGVRSPQGLDFDKQGTLWESEMGPRGGDEINIIGKAKNYGWPAITYGREYWGPKIGEGTAKEGMEQPVVYWVPSISPSGMKFYYNEKNPKWNGSLFLGTLSGVHLRRLVIENNKVTQQEVLLKEAAERFRSVNVSPNGELFVSTDSGKIMRVIP